MITYWRCEECRKTGQLDIPDDQGVYQAVYDIGDAHRAVSPACIENVNCIRVSWTPFQSKPLTREEGR